MTTMTNRPKASTRDRPAAPAAGTASSSSAPATSPRQVAPVPATPTPHPGADVDDLTQQAAGTQRRPPKSYLAFARTSAAELRASNTFQADFGTLGPQATDLATNLERSADWRTARGEADDWQHYVLLGDKAAWTTTLSQLDQFEHAFEHALSVDPTVRQRYPQTAALLGIRKAAAAKGVVTRKRKAAAKAAAKAATQAAPVPSATPAESSVPATPATPGTTPTK